MLMASPAFLTPASKPLIWEVILEEMARPAASSFAEFIRLPVDSRSIAVFIDRSLRTRAFCATEALTLVLTELIVILRGLVAR
jgi:hypothetical protein